MLTERRIRDAKAESKTRFLWDAQVKNLGVRITPKGVKSYVVFYRSAGQEAPCDAGAGGGVVATGGPGQSGAAVGRDSRRRSAPAGKAAPGEGGADRGGWAGSVLRRVRTNAAGPSVAWHRAPYRSTAVRRSSTSGRLSAGNALLTWDVGTWSWPLGGCRARPATARWRSSRGCSVCSRRGSGDRSRRTPCAASIARAKTPEIGCSTRRSWRSWQPALDRLDERFPASVAAIRVAALTGLRISEVLAIRWEHVDFASRRVTLPQTKTGRRSHHFPAAALDIMRAVPRLNEGHHVFAVDARGALTYRTVRHHFGDAVKRAGLSDVRLHDLRRTFMTNAAAAGVGTHVLRDLLGHKSTAMADRYVRSVGSPVADAREAVGSAMAAAMAGEGAGD